MKIGTTCKSVVCCRVTPIQKSLVVTAVQKQLKGKITLSIGDGANDVSMIQAAHIGIGVMGKEGTQAVRASDFAIAEFRFLRRLIAVHGRYSNLRISNTVMFSFYKNIFMISVMWCFGFQSMFSGTLNYEELFMTAYNIFFTSLPPLMMCMFDRDVDDEYIEKYPELYIQVRNGAHWNFKTAFGWLVASIWHSAGLNWINSSVIRLCVFCQRRWLDIIKWPHIRLLGPSFVIWNTSFM